MNAMTKHNLDRQVAVGKVHALLCEPELRPLPGAPSFIAGMVLVQGRWIPVLNVTSVEPDAGQPILVIESNLAGADRSLFGVIGNFLEEVGAVNTPSALHQPPADFPCTEAAADFTSAVDELCALLGTRKALAS